MSAPTEADPIAGELVTVAGVAERLNPASFLASPKGGDTIEWWLLTVGRPPVQWQISLAVAGPLSRVLRDPGRLVDAGLIHAVNVMALRNCDRLLSPRELAAGKGRGDPRESWSRQLPLLSVCHARSVAYALVRGVLHGELDPVPISYEHRLHWDRVIDSVLDVHRKLSAVDPDVEWEKAAIDTQR